MLSAEKKMILKKLKSKNWVEISEAIDFIVGLKEYALYEKMFVGTKIHFCETPRADNPRDEINPRPIRGALWYHNNGHEYSPPWETRVKLNKTTYLPVCYPMIILTKKECHFQPPRLLTVPKSMSKQEKLKLQPLYNAAFSILFAFTPDSFLKKLGFSTDIIHSKQKISVTYFDYDDIGKVGSYFGGNNGDGVLGASAFSEVGVIRRYSSFITYCELLPLKLKDQAIIYKDTMPGLPYSKELVKKAFWKNNKNLLVKLLKEARIIP